MRKRSGSIILICLIIFTAILAGDFFLRRKSIYDDLLLTFKNTSVEYGSDVEATDLIESINGDLEYVSQLDSFKPGQQKIRYTIASYDERYHQKITRDYELDVEVKDTRKPIIEFKEDCIYIYRNDDYDFRENIKEIYDPVDGEIKDYTISNNVAFDKCGEYDVEVTATDINGLTEKRSYKLIIRNRPVSGQEGYALVYNYLTSKYGYNKAAACGICANIRFESDFNPDAGEYYYGLCQWGGSRKDELFSYCMENGFDATDIEGQLAFMDYELNGSYRSVKDHLFNIENSSLGAYDSAEYFCRYYEGAASENGRGQLAVDYFGS